MKLNKIKLEYFLKHEHLELEFTDGLNTIRGKNEIGKSSLIEGLGYNLFGSAALEGTLEETLNWNAKSKSALKTFTEFEHAGSKFTCSRGDSGAELIRDGKVVCTGHKEVTAYIESMLGIPKGRSKDIVLANQNAIRGVLSLGPTAAADFIEKLADFSQVDGLIKQLSTRLTTGSTKALEEQLALAQANLDACVIPPVPDHTQLLSELGEQLTEATAQVSQLRNLHQDQKIKFDAASAEQKRLNADIDVAQGRINSVAQQIKDAELVLALKSQNEASLQVVNESLAEAAKRRIYDKLLVLMKTRTSGPVWAGSVEDFNTARGAAAVALRETQDQIVALTAQRNALLGSKISAGKCPTCGTVIGDPEAAAAHNLKVDAEAESLRLQIIGLGQTGKELSEEGQQYQQIADAQAQLEAWLLPNQAYVSKAEGELPMELGWVGGCPQVVVGEPQLMAEAARLSDAIGRAGDAANAIANLQFQSEQHQEALAAADSLLQQVVLVAPDAELLLQAGARGDAAAALRANIRRLEDEVTAAKTLAAAKVEEQGRLMCSVTALNTSISTQRADTVFLKAVKDARVLVAEKLWGVVMGGVSNYFSRLRGVPSIVVRTANGFAVDGKTSRPSGSTLDILGLALRIVVSKVFANCGLMVIDEPSSGCDKGRTANMAAVMMGSGFDQVIWVSHSDIAEAGAVNLIEL